MLSPKVKRKTENFKRKKARGVSKKGNATRHVFYKLKISDEKLVIKSAELGKNLLFLLTKRIKGDIINMQKF